MKKILLATSALVAMSSVAVAGDIPAAPMAPMVAGFTVTATGEAVIFGFFNGTGAGTVGVGGSFEGELKAAKTLDNGSDVFVTLNIDNTNAAFGSIGYNSAIGNFLAGNVDADDHGVEVPGAPDVPVVGDLEDGLTFADTDLSAAGLYTTFAGVPAVFAAKTLSVTYASPTFGGFQLGLGANTTGAIDVQLAGEFDASGAIIKVGAGATGPAATFSTAGSVMAGASIEISGFTLGAKAVFAVGPATTTFEAGAAFVTGPFTVAAKYAATAAAPGTGTVTAGAQFAENGLTIIADGSVSLAALNAFTASTGATFSFGDFKVGAVATAAGTTAAASVSFGAKAGVDFALNSNVTIGAGVGFSNSAAGVSVFGAAAGLKVSF